MKDKELSIKQVEEFWNNNLCGNHFVKSKFPTKEFFSEYRDFRYKKTHHLLKYINWQAASNKDVLEIGLGIGADATLWGKYAKSYTGVDLTQEAVMATQMHLDTLNLKGNIFQANAEKLPFEDESFDIIYSHGVLHHTTNITVTFKEAFRVLRMKGSFIVMLYAKGSFNYWIRIQLYFRIRLLVELFKNKLSLKSNATWSKHLNNFNNQGWSYISWNVFPHHCTDGPDCEIANIYYKREVVALLKNCGFNIVKYKKAHFPIGSRFPKLERFIAGFIGFHQIFWVTK
jgi:ubiquinone/menaquinone biosynthesis C-methylase UbiE